MNGVLIVPGPNLRYYTGGNSLLMERPFLFLVPQAGEMHLVAPALEAGPYLRNSMKITVHQWTDNEGPTTAICEVCSQIPIAGSWGSEGSTPFRFINLLQKHVKLSWLDADRVLQNIREVKDDTEIHLLRRAAIILAKSFIRTPSILRPGITELECARKFTQVINDNGADSVGDVLVQAGAMAADPHHLASKRKLRRNEAIVVDATCQFGGYYADITRTFMIGKDEKFEDIYLTVLGAQESGIKNSQPNVTVGSVDAAVRSYIEQRGFGKYFFHRTGHGLGLEVHEAPYIVSDGDERLRTSMAFTVEPGIYLPGKLGVRIEDELLVTRDGREVLTRLLPKEFGWWR